MSFLINDQLLDEIRDRADIVELIGEYVNLKRSGSNFMGLCPFHSEKTPSFSVSQDKKIFKCFGCGEGGDVITFVMKKENLDFRDAIEFLADKYAIELVDAHPVNEEKKKRIERLLLANKTAATYFYKNLFKSQKVINYLKTRKLSSREVNYFGLGYAKDSWSDLKEYMISKGFTERELIDANLIVKSDSNKSYDRFRDRLMFPIIDLRSQVIGFGGRVLSDKKPKYLNSNENEIFIKGNNLYNINNFIKLKDRKKLLLVEGYMDVISLSKSGINYCVASLGTSLTKNQAKLLKRYTEEVYICYDGDLAGLNAAKRAIDILLDAGFKPKVVQLPEGLDPDDYIEKEGSFNFEVRLRDSLGYIEFKVEMLKKNFNLEDPEGLSKFSIESAKIFSGIKNPIERDIYVKEFCSKYKISQMAMKNYIDYPKNSSKNSVERTKHIKKVPKVKMGAKLQLIRYAMESRENYDIIRNRIVDLGAEDSQARIIFQELKNYYENHLSQREFLSELIELGSISKEYANALMSIKPVTADEKKLIDELILTLQKDELEISKNIILGEISKLKTSSDQELIKEKLKKLQEINLKLNSLNERGKL